MSQVTRCPHCQTSFKVVDDQLRVADGWVRCGQCKQVFDAFENMLEAGDSAKPEPLLSLPDELALPPVAEETSERVLEPQAVPELPGGLPLSPALPVPPVAPQEPPTPPAPAELPAWRLHLHDLVGAPGQPQQPDPDFQIDEPPPQPFGQRMEPVLEPVPAMPEFVVSEPDVEPRWDDAVAPLPEAEAATETVPEAEPTMEERVLEPALEIEETSGSTAQHEPAPEPGAAPAEEASNPDFDFVRAARRGAFWRKPLVRAVLAILFLALVAVLALQVAVQQRDRLAEAYPLLQPLLKRLCEPLQCTVGVPRQIADVAIDASSFARLRDDEPVYALQLTVKNSAAIAVAMPALELTLIDAREPPVVRRVLTAVELGAPDRLAARGSWGGAVQRRLQEGASRVTGYRLLAFYP